MHIRKDELEAQRLGDYEGRMADLGDGRLTSRRKRAAPAPLSGRRAARDLQSLAILR
jgi:hypothetical protein